MGAPPANSFVPTGDALAPYNQIANTPKNQKISWSLADSSFR